MSTLNLPRSNSTVKVSVISGGRVKVPTKYCLKGYIPGHDHLDVPSFVFLIENESKSKKVLFDLGWMKNWRDGIPPAIGNQIKAAGSFIDIEKDIPDILVENGITLDSINAVIWSHHHVDHVGDPSLFPPTTDLVVGPNFKDAVAGKTYPSNPDGIVLESAWAGRTLVQIEPDFVIGDHPAFDYFGDGSLYLLASPGHTADHICALARTTSDTFVYLGGDICHHPGQFRPTEALSLPSEVTLGPHTCPGSLFLDVHPKHDPKTPFYELPEIAHADVHEATKSVTKMTHFDAHPDVFVIIAHDDSLTELLEFYPASINAWKEKQWNLLGRWRFLRDLVQTKS